MIHHSPNDSADHQHLRSLASKMQVSEVSIREFLWLMNAPDKLYALIHIASQLRKAIDVGLEIPVQYQVTIFSKWVKILDYIIAHEHDILRSIPYADEGLGSPITKNPMMGKGIGRHSMYMALWNRHEENVYA